VITPDEQASDAKTPAIRPSRLWYWVAAGVLVGAVICVALAVAGFFSVNRQIQDFQRVRVPGQAELHFADAGGYVLYLEQPGQCCSFAAGGGESAPFPRWWLNLGLRSAGYGVPVLVRTWQGTTESYSVNGHEGQTAMYFTIEQPGWYQLAARNAVPRSITDVAVGRGVGQPILTSVLLGLAGLLALAPAGVVTGAVTAVRRRRARRGLLAVPPVTPPAVGMAAIGVPGRYRPGPGQPAGSQPVPYSPGGQLAARLSYLEGAPVGFGDAIKQAFRYGFTYRGRASRSAFWWFVLFLELITVGLTAVLIPVGIGLSGSGGSGTAGFLIILLFLIPGLYLDLVWLALLVRRLHDTGRSGWWALIGLVPFAGPIVLLIFTLEAGEPRLNRYQPTLLP
jgi:uncharacterized membrane protein YhaH (DUF805 family)